VLVDILTDGHDELFQVAKNSALDSRVGQIMEGPLDHVPPRRRGRGEVHMETLGFRKPTLHARMFVRRIVVVR